MVRTPRIIIPGYPHHIVQKGHNKQAIFRDDHDRLLYLELMVSYAERYECGLMAYCLMSNHVHLLIRPGSREFLVRFIHGLGFRYAMYFNDSDDRSGALWEGRYYSSLIMEQLNLWRAAAYICLNPVRAGLVRDPCAYPWSSARGLFNNEPAGVPIDNWLDDNERHAFKAAVVSEIDSLNIQKALKRNLPYASKELYTNMTQIPA